MAHRPSFVKVMIGRSHGGSARQHRIRANVQQLFPRNAVAPDRDHAERAAGAEVEDRLDRLAEARARANR